MEHNLKHKPQWFQSFVVTEMFYEFLLDVPVHQQGVYFALGLLSFSILLFGWILYACRIQYQEPETEIFSDEFQEDVLTQKQTDESQQIEQEARAFYSKPSTMRYRLSGIERLKVTRGQDQNPDSEHVDSTNHSHQESSKSSDDEETMIWNQAIISSITFRKSPEQDK